MNALFELVKNQMQKHNVKQYQEDSVLIDIAPLDKFIIPSENDFYFFANAFTSSGIANGKVRGTAGGNALNINPTNLNTKLYKHQMFKGEIRFINNSSENTLFVELLRVTPIPEKFTNDNDNE